MLHGLRVYVWDAWQDLKLPLDQIRSVAQVSGRDSGAGPWAVFSQNVKSRSVSEPRTASLVPFCASH